MIKLGICAPVEVIEAVEKIGFDYIECGLSSLMSATEDEFRAYCERVDSAGIKVEAFNGMLPGTLKITGGEVNAQSIRDYLSRAFARAKRLGGRIVVFGSSSARNVPEGYPIDMAWRQICNFLRMAERYAIDNDITIAIEPLRRAESNVINMVSEAVMISSILQLNHVRALGDTYHMAIGSEPASVLEINAPMIAHMHTANSMGRFCPKADDGEDYEKYMRALKGGGYEGRMSIEGVTDPFVESAEAGFKRLDEARRAVWAE